jgi:hypothetical protein
LRFSSRQFLASKSRRRKYKRNGQAQQDSVVEEFAAFEMRIGKGPRCHPPVTSWEPAGNKQEGGERTSTNLTEKIPNNFKSIVVI